jgi:hypothetical protein
MPSLRESIRKALEARYALLRHSFQSQIPADGEWRAPVWIDGTWPTSQTLSSDDPVPDSATLIDPEVGIIMRFIPFDAANLRTHIIRALNVRSALRQEEPTSQNGDEYGSWRIVLVWLVENAHDRTWGEVISNIRDSTGFSEELSFERLLYEQGKERDAAEVYAYPRLLLTLRQVLAFSEETGAAQWLSADTQVRKLLASLPLEFSDPTEKELARQIAAYEAPSATTAQPSPDSPSPWHRGEPFRQLSIAHFRGLRNVEISFPDEPVNPLVVFGPNGTGKSSIAEAIALARFGVSPRLDRFCSKEVEKDAPERDKEQEYRNRYLAPIGDDGLKPAFSLHSNSHDFWVADADNRPALRHAMDRNILTQEETARFPAMSASECAAKVLQGYSELADTVRQRVEISSAEASSARQEYLRSLGISPQITRLETVEERIIRLKLDALNLRFTPQITSWIRAADSIPEGLTLSDKIEAFCSENRRDQIASLAAKKTASDTDRVRAICGYFEDYNLLVRLVNKQIEEVREQSDANAERIQELGHNLHTWGEWQQTRSAGKEPTSPPIAQQASEELSHLRKELDDVKKRGRMARARRTHLEAVNDFLASGWEETNPNTCPTCASDVATAGGIHNRVAQLLIQTDTELEELAGKSNELRKIVETKQSDIAVTRPAEMPLSQEETAAALRAFQWLTPSAVPFDQYITNPSSRAALLDTATELSKVPAPPDELLEVEQQAGSLVDSISEELARAAEVLRLPNAWDSIQKSLLSKLTQIVERHLPETAEKLWREIALSLTSANWINAKLPTMKADTRRKTQRLVLDIDGRLPRYLLNRSEINVLGLAWFFADYLLKGRFEIPLMVLDDPAQEMDQTTFREFARFLETVVRLHRRTNSELALIVLMHHESRAFELARALRSFWMTLAWDSAKAQATEMSVAFDPGLRPASPRSLAAASQ